MRIIFIFFISFSILAKAQRSNVDSVFIGKDTIVGYVKLIDKKRATLAKKLDDDQYSWSTLRLKKISHIVLNGKTYIKPDSLFYSSTVKFSRCRTQICYFPFSLGTGHVAAGIERSLTYRCALTFKAGYANNKVFHGGFRDYYVLGDHLRGCFISSGIKFNLGHSYFRRKTQEIQPLAGNFLQPELIIGVTKAGVKEQTPENGKIVTKSATQTTTMLALMAHFGQQRLLFHRMIIGYKVGVGTYLYRTTFDCDYSFSYLSTYDNNMLSYGFIATPNIPLALQLSSWIGFTF